MLHLYALFVVVYFIKVEIFFIIDGLWPRGLRRGSAAARLPRLWVWIPPRAWKFSVASVVCCQVEVSATRWSLVQRRPTDCDASLCVCDLETSWTRSSWPTGGLSRQEQTNKNRRLGTSCSLSQNIFCDLFWIFFLGVYFRKIHII